jgi:hypothetical protein
LGCGIVALGLSGLFADAVSAHNPAEAVAIHNSSVALSALLHLSGISLREGGGVRARGPWLSGAYLATVGAVCLIALASLNGILPTFFIPGSGGTPLRTFVLGASIAMFVVTACLSSRLWRSSDFSYWYSLGLLSVSAALFGFLIQTSIWSPLAWTGRGALYLGGVYLVMAALSSVREAQVWGDRKTEQRCESEASSHVGLLVVLLADCLPARRGAQALAS